MSIPRNIAAFTSLDHPYPAYISVNETSDGQISISLRGSADGEVEGPLAQAVLSREDAGALFKEATENLAKEPTP